jgi:hypothetical protein
MHLLTEVSRLESPGARSVFGKGFLQGCALSLPIDGRDASSSLDRPSVEPRHFCAVKDTEHKISLGVYNYAFSCAMSRPNGMSAHD